jgi:hypothetical protein
MTDAGIVLILYGIPLYLTIVLEFSEEEQAASMQLMFGMSLLLLPVTGGIAWIIQNRISIDPIRLFAASGPVCALASWPAHWYAQVVREVYGEEFGVRHVAMYAVWSGLCLNIGLMMDSIGTLVLIGRVVDEDQVLQAKERGVLNKQEIDPSEIPARRDGSIASIRTIVKMAGGFWVGAFQFLLGAAGYDANRDTQPQGAKVMCITVMQIVVPMCYAVFSCLILRIALRGKYLKRLKQDHQKLYGERGDDSGT